VVESGCRYHSPIAFPQAIDAGLRVEHLGRSSVRYAIGLFAVGQDIASADGHFVHVTVDRRTRRPVHIPAQLRRSLTNITGTVN
jgi:acyl-CoA thioester hydrolase